MKEAQVLRQIRQYLDFLSSAGKLYYNRVTTQGKVYGNGVNQRFIPNGDMMGMPDLIIYLPFGKVMFVEVKGTRGVLSEGQENWKRRVEKLGHKYCVVHSLDEVCLLMSECGVDTLLPISK